MILTETSRKEAAKPDSRRKDHDSTAGFSRQALLAAWCRENRITQSFLSEVTGLSCGYISHIFKGKRRSRAAIDKLAEAGVPCDLLPAPGAGRGERKAA